MNRGKKVERSRRAERRPRATRRSAAAPCGRLPALRGVQTLGWERTQLLAVPSQAPPPTRPAWLQSLCCHQLPELPSW